MAKPRPREAAIRRMVGFFPFEAVDEIAFNLGCVDLI
jgi:hypothetical protein